MAISMDEKAANDGDKLKHPLLLEVLARCKDWNSLTYTESHAGAGKYLAAAQPAGKSHITSLFNSVFGLQDRPTDEVAGGRYYHLLQDWWSDEGRAGTYPGSVLQAARFLTNQKVEAEFRVTEAHKDTYDRLVKAANEYGVQPRHEKFQNKIDWLIEKDSLVLLIDPLSFAKDFGKNRDKKLNKGSIDLHTLTKVLAPCWTKKSAVVLFWSGFAHATGQEKKRLVYTYLKCECKQKDSSFCCYHIGTYHIFIMGIGKGKEVTDELHQLDWSVSWLPIKRYSQEIATHD